VVAVHRLEGSPLVDAFLARPFDDAALARLSRRGLEIAGEPTTEDPEVRSHLLPTYEAACGARGEAQDHETAMAPLVARGRVVAALGIVTIAPVGERELRLFFSTVNQVSLHLDRILAVAEAEKNRFRSMLDSMPQSVLLADLQLRVIEANAAARRLVEQAGLLDDAGRIARVGDLDLIAIAGSVTRTCAPHGPFEAKLSDGTLLTLTASALRGDPGDTEGLVLVLTDVTESRQLQAQLAQAEKLSTIGELVSGIAHELNNPLASVLGYAQLLESAAADPRVSKRVGIIHAEARRCQKIVQNLLSFARRHDPERKPFSLNEVVESVLGLVAYQLRVANVRVERALDPELPSVLGDAHQIRQVVLNLVTNAYQAIRDTGREGRVLVRTSVARPGWVDLIVQDDGPGIAEADRGRIFDPFFTTKGAGQGTGLGLSLASGTVTAHGGRIEVESKAGEGAMFRVELPVGTAPAAASDPSFLLDETDPCTPSRILVVDDEDPIANLIFETLTSEGHHVRVAHTGNEALGLLTSEPFDLVVADVRMPGLGGTRLHEEMERIRPGISRRIVLTTGDFLGHEAKALADRTGADALLKPFDLAELRRAVRARLRACGGN
jgi:two-component system NtrC family sensor kinase